MMSCIGLPPSFLCLLCLFVANSVALSFLAFALCDGFLGGELLRFLDWLLCGLQFHRPFHALFRHFFLRGFLCRLGCFLLCSLGGFPDRCFGGLSDFHRCRRRHRRAF